MRSPPASRGSSSGQPLAASRSSHPLDVLGSGQFVGDLGDQHADVDVVELAAVLQLRATALTSSLVSRRFSSAISGTRSGPGTPSG